MLTKQALRDKILSKLKSQKEVKRNKKSLLILRRLFRLPDFIRAKTILFYLAFDGEVETRRMIKEALKKGKKIALPVIYRKTKALSPFLIQDLTTQTARGPYGIMQPHTGNCRRLSLSRIDLAIIPGIAFDKVGNRLGRGAGYYDRFLLKLPKDTTTIGLAFDFQVLKDIPHSSFDLPVKKVLSA
ncbi:MAG: 5-formyltetrahydrofolate cyclo-ligase [Candidatus Omnitrophota bacterium]